MSEAPAQPQISNSPAKQTTLRQIAKPQIKWDLTQGLIKSLEAKLGGKVVTYYISSGGWMLSQDDVKYFYAHLKNIGHQEKLFFVLYSSGGNGMGAWRIASLLNDFCDELVIVIPEMAASAATMLSLAADELIMTPLAYLTAVDTSLNHPLNPRDERNQPVSVELDQVKRAVKLLQNGDKTNTAEVYKTIFSYIHPIALGAIERSTTLSELICQNIMELPKKRPLKKEVIEDVIHKLNTQFPSHGYPIPRHKAKELGLNITYSDKELDDLLWKLINTYRFMTEPARTDMSESFFHTETLVKTIESEGTMLGLINVYERKIDPVIRGWTTLKDEFNWASFSIKEENGTRRLMSSKLEF